MSYHKFTIPENSDVQFLGGRNNHEFSVLTQEVSGSVNMLTERNTDMPVMVLTAKDETLPFNILYAGLAGKSAYQIAVENGFSGTESEWLASLVGPPGNTIQIVAPIDLGGGRVVTNIGTYADNSDGLTLGMALGVTQGAASQGAVVNITTFGELNGFFGLSVNMPVFLSALGMVTQSVPVSGYLQNIGIALSSTKIFINISEPIQL